jgi:hypothetical protein
MSDRPGRTAASASAVNMPASDTAATLETPAAWIRRRWLKGMDDMAMFQVVRVGVTDKGLKY